MTPPSDETALLNRLKEGDPAAYRALSERYLKTILNYAYRLLGDATEAEDVCQETFLRLWQQVERWEPRAKVSTWLFRVAHNGCVDRLRARRPTEDYEAPAADSVSPSALTQRLDVARKVQAALSELPVRQRAALVMSHFEGMGNPEIAAVLGLTVDAVESLLARARRTLREQLGSITNEAQSRGAS